MFQQPGLAWVHWAPPCGTFSRAREIRRRRLHPLCAIPDTSKAFPICEALTSAVSEAPTRSLNSWRPSAASSQPEVFAGASKTPPTASCGVTQTSKQSLHPVIASPSTRVCTAPDVRRAPQFGHTARGSKTSTGPATAPTSTCREARHVIKAASYGAPLWRVPTPNP